MSLFARLRQWLCGLLGHPVDPLIVMKGPQAYWECRRCFKELAPMLSGQMHPVRPLRKLTAKVVEQPHRILPMVGRKFRA